jgi:hypothetical protein
MNGFRRRHGTPQLRVMAARLAPAALALAFVGGCGSGAPGSTTSTAERGAGAEVNSESAARGGLGARQSSRAGATPLGSVIGENATPAVAREEHRLPNPFLCSRDPVAFDLSKLHPGGGTPVGFAGAWDYAQDHSELPGFVVAYSGTMWGPAITARVGAVHPVANGVYSFMEVLPATVADTVSLDPRDPFHIRTEHPNQNFITAFGKLREREGFVVSDITVEGRLDQTCQYMRGVTVTMTLPRENVGQRFGATTVDEALGPMTVVTHSGGEPEAWSVTLTGDSLDNVMFKL